MTVENIRLEAKNDENVRKVIYKDHYAVQIVKNLHEQKHRVDEFGRHLDGDNKNVNFDEVDVRLILDDELIMALLNKKQLAD